MADNYSPTSRDSERIAGQHSAQGEHLSYPRSVVIGVVTLCALTAVLTVWNMRERLSLDLPVLGDGIQNAEEYAKGILEMQDDQLRAQDSDQDGLTDYEELRVYGTSPFIADTDSDKIADADEVKAGGDPNCPVGKNCTLANAEFATGTRTSSPYAGPEILAIIDNPAEIRRLLIEGGVDARVLETIDDQSLQLLAQEALNATTQPTPEKLELIKNLQPSQIRALLREQGFADDVLSQITDDQLMAIFQQAYVEATAPKTN
jgi:hypothetical protein